MIFKATARENRGDDNDLVNALAAIASRRRSPARFNTEVRSCTASTMPLR